MGTSHFFQWWKNLVFNFQMKKSEKFLFFDQYWPHLCKTRNVMLRPNTSITLKYENPDNAKFTLISTSNKVYSWPLNFFWRSLIWVYLNYFTKSEKFPLPSICQTQMQKLRTSHFFLNHLIIVLIWHSNKIMNFSLYRMIQ